MDWWISVVMQGGAGQGRVLGLEVWSRVGLGSVEQGWAGTCGAGLGFEVWSRAGWGSVEQGWTGKC